MPYEWHDAAPDESGAVSYRLRVWPYRSLPRRGFVWFIGTTAVLLLLPILPVLGTVVLWGLLPFLGLAIWGIWTALQGSYRSGETVEEMTLSRDALDLRRVDPGRNPREWHTNPHWVRVLLRDGPVEDYLILTDGRREIELGAFLTPGERRDLCADLQRRLTAMR